MEWATSVAQWKDFFRRIVEDDLTQKINDYNSEIEKIRKIMNK